MDIIAFPKSTIPVTVCNHRYGAKATICQDSDTAQVNHLICEMMAFRHNFKLTDFVNPYNAPTSGLKDINESGRIEHSLYLPTDRWINPTTGAVQLIPDYTSTTWTTSGEQFFDVTSGQSKNARYPNHGQEMFDISDGRLGWDMVNGVAGENGGQEWFKLLDALQFFFTENIGKKVSGFAYRNGETKSALMNLPYFLGGRNSAFLQTSLEDNGQTDYGLGLGFPDNIPTSRELKINQVSTSRFKDFYQEWSFGTRQEVLEYIKDQVRLTIENGGYHNDFIHRYQWGATPQVQYFDDLLFAIKEEIGNDFVWTSGFGEAMEYLFYRELVGRVSAFEQNGAVKIIIQKSDKFKELETSGFSHQVLYDLIRVPISIEIDLSSTVLSGKNIKVDNGSIKSLGSNKYIIQIPFGNTFEGFAGVEITEDEEANYLDFSIPNAILNKSGSTITVTANKDVRCVLFRSATGGNDWDYTVHSRSNDLKGVHTFNISGFTTGYDFRAGVITEQEQSKLLQ